MSSTPEHEPSRLDVALVSRGIARSRGHARDLVAAGEVLLDGAVVAKPSLRVAPRQHLQLAGHRTASDVSWVGRGAVKLAHAFALWEPLGLTARGRRCLDVGASTGGFTQVLLARGAAQVIALDVGHGQLAPQLAADPRVVERSGVNVRDVTARDLPGGPVQLVVADLSFISLTLVLPRLRPLMALAGGRPSGGVREPTRGPADAILLVKPQFEVGRARLGRSGVVRHAATRRDALYTVLTVAVETGHIVRDLVHSPIRGGSGNREYLLWVSSFGVDAAGPPEVAGRTLGAPAGEPVGEPAGAAAGTAPSLTLDGARARVEELVGQEVAG